MFGVYNNLIELICEKFEQSLNKNKITEELNYNTIYKVSNNMRTK